MTASQNDTIITPGSGYVTDNSGDLFQITAAGTVDMNFKPLGYTANVVDAAWVNGNFWQQNSSGLWWEYTGNPNAPWTGLGTSQSPLAGYASPDGTMISPGNGVISDNQGDTFTITSSGTVDMNGQPLGYTANVVDAAWANGHFWQMNSSGLWWEYTGNPSAPWTGLGTSNSPLPHSISMNGGTIYLSNGNNSLQVGGNNDTVNLTGNEHLALSEAPGTYPNIAINSLAPGNSLDANNIGGLVDDSINLASNLTLTGTLDLAGDLYVSGNGTLIDNGELQASTATIDSNVLGNGTMTYTNIHDGAGWGIVAGSSGAGITYDLTANIESVTMTVDHPDTFHSAVDMNTTASFLDLAGLSASSYDFKNDLLTLYSGNKAVYQLNLSDKTTDPIYVTSRSSGVTVGVWNSEFGPAPTGLPQHSAIA